MPVQIPSEAAQIIFKESGLPGFCHITVGGLEGIGAHIILYQDSSVCASDFYKLGQAVMFVGVQCGEEGAHGSVLETQGQGKAGKAVSSAIICHFRHTGADGAAEMLQKIQAVALCFDEIQIRMIQVRGIPSMAETPVGEYRPSQAAFIDGLFGFQTGNAVALIEIYGIKEIFFFRLLQPKLLLPPAYRQ